MSFIPLIMEMVNEKLPQKNEYDKEPVLASLNDLKKEVQKTDPDIAKDLHELHLSLEKHNNNGLFEKTEKLLTKIEQAESQKERMESMKKLVALQTQIRNKKGEIKDNMRYESTSENEIAAMAEKGRQDAVNNVQAIVDNTSFIPNRLKKLST